MSKPDARASVDATSHREACGACPASTAQSRRRRRVLAAVYPCPSGFALDGAGGVCGLVTTETW
jgi:hypothetical protein